MTFWDTIRGHQLADTIIRDLPLLARPRKQSIITLAKDDTLPDNLERLLKENKKIEHVIPLQDKVVCIYISRK